MVSYSRSYSQVSTIALMRCKRRPRANKVSIAPYPQQAMQRLPMRPSPSTYDASHTKYSVNTLLMLLPLLLKLPLFLRRIWLDPKLAMALEP